MALSKTLQQLRESIRYNIQVENVARQSNGDARPLTNALQAVPENDMWRQLQWLHEILLPSIEEKRGEDSENYKTFSGVRDSLVWCLSIISSYERLLMLRAQDTQLLEFYKQKNAFLELELSKYTTAELLICNEAMVDVRRATVERAINYVTNKQKIQ